MAVLKFVLIFYLLKFSLSKNIFLERLNLLLDYCLIHEVKADSSLLLGSAFAKSQLAGLKGENGKGDLEGLMRKCDELEKRFVQSALFDDESNGISE